MLTEYRKQAIECSHEGTAAAGLGAYSVMITKLIRPLTFGRYADAKFASQIGLLSCVTVLR